LDKLAEKRGKTIWAILFAIVFIFPVSLCAQQAGDPTMGQGMMGGGPSGQGMMGSGVMPLPKVPWITLVGMIQHWEEYLLVERISLGLTDDQLDKIESLFTSQRKDLIRKNADRNVSRIEIEELLLKGQVDLTAVEEKVKAMEAVRTDMIMGMIQTLENASAVLNADQREKAKAFFKESILMRFLKVPQPRSKMMGGGMME
jgi:Spy/CpxP family protein refolding chaperone